RPAPRFRSMSRSPVSSSSPRSWASKGETAASYSVVPSPLVGEGARAQRGRERGLLRKDSLAKRPPLPAACGGDPLPQGERVKTARGATTRSHLAHHNVRRFGF